MSNVTVQLTPDFTNDDKLKEAQALLIRRNIPISYLLTAWSKCAKMSLRSGKYYARVPKIKELSTLVEIDERIYNSPGFEAMKAVGMIKLAESDTAPSVLGDEHYEQWYNAYPARNVNEKNIKVRGKSKIRFHNQIRTPEDFGQLMNATRNYISLSGKLVKDPERFLANDFWKEYIPKEPVGRGLDSDALSRMMNAN
jgi:hypothetical protein